MSNLFVNDDGKCDTEDCSRFLVISPFLNYSYSDVKLEGVNNLK